MADMHMPGVLSYDCSWTSGAQEICNRAIARHGGWTAWNQLDSIRMSPLSLSGLLPYLKGYQKTFTLPTCFEVFPRTYRVVFYGFPQAGEIAEFSRGDLRIIGSNQGVVNTIKQARTKYRGLAKFRFWRPMDCLYFFGYAWTTYLSCPFVFPTFKLLRSFAHQERGQRWDALDSRGVGGRQGTCHEKHGSGLSPAGRKDSEDRSAMIRSESACGNGTVNMRMEE